MHTATQALSHQNSSISNDQVWERTFLEMFLHGMALKGVLRLHSLWLALVGQDYKDRSRQETSSFKPKLPLHTSLSHGAYLSVLLASQYKAPSRPVPPLKEPARHAQSTHLSSDLSPLENLQHYLLNQNNIRIHPCHSAFA